MIRNFCRLATRSNAQAVRRVHGMRFNSTLVLAEHDGKALNEASLSLVTAATQLGAPVHVLVAGKDVGAIAQSASTINGVAGVFQAEHDALSNQVAENVTNLVVQMHKEHNFTNIVAAGSSVGKGVIPRVAASLDVATISEVIKVKSSDTFVRPIYAGNALCTVQSQDSVKVMTVRPTSFDKAASGGSAAVTNVTVDASVDAGLSSWVEDKLSVSERPELASAASVVSGGRALGSEENFGLINGLADAFGAAVGASRAAVDAGYAPNDMQVGQTGKVVAPDLYVAVGISGAIQHLAGMKDSKTIVAINQDPDAPIFQVADYGVVGDLFNVVPELTDKVKAAKA